VYSFLHTRLQTIPRSARIQDTVSIILFNQQASVPYVHQSLTDANIILKILVQHLPSGGTDFGSAIEQAGSLIDTYFDPKK
ncbi:3500_t:CDS:1, partial [Funneliformis mosseae]